MKAQPIKLRWFEPWFFVQKNYSQEYLRVRVTILVLMYVWFVSDSTTIFARNFVELDNKVVQAIINVLCWNLLFESFRFRREVILGKYEFTWSGIPYLWPFANLWFLELGQRNRAEIDHIEIRRPLEATNHFPHGVLSLFPKRGQEIKMAISPKIPIEKVASHIHAMGIKVALSNWTPEPEQAPATAP